jgi:DNA-binding SARP family transcriptional activator/predicted ATPase
VIQRQLPLPWTEFVGRERERASLARLLLRARLVTVVGLSGVGKSRLARQVAQDLLSEFAGQVWFVPCEGLANAAAILPILGEATSQSDARSAETSEFMSHLAGRRGLLFLDTAECLLAKGLREFLCRWLEQVPEVAVLLTSLAPTGLVGEHLFTLRPMYPSPSLLGPDSSDGLLPDAADPALWRDWREADGLRLFEARAQQRDCEWQLTPSNLSAVIELCREMDWLPLGIELAAGQLSPWTEAQLLEQIRRRGHQLDLTAPGGAERHESLRRAIEWSWSLLSAPEQQLIRVLAALGGHLLEEALEPLMAEREAPQVAASLFRKGFLHVEEQAGRLRYSLPEAIRRFAAEQSPVSEETIERAAAFYLELARREGDRLGTAQAAAAAAVLRLEMPLLRQCWVWAEERGDGERLCGFARALCGPLLHELELPAEARELVAAATAHVRNAGEDSFWLAWLTGAVAARFGSADEAMSWLRDCLDATAPEPVRALALKELGQLQIQHGQPLVACETLQQSVTALSRLGMEAEAAWARRSLAGAYERLGDRAGAHRLLEEVRLQFSELELSTGQASVCADLARLAADEERWDTAEARSQEAVRHYHVLGHGAGWATAALQVARVRARQGALDEAERLYRVAFERLRASGSAVPVCLGLLQVAAEQHAPVRPVEPAKAYRECIALARERGLRSLLAHALRGLADLYVTQGGGERALTLAQEAVQVARQTTEAPLIQACLDLLGGIQGSGKGSAPADAPSSPPVYVESVVVRALETPVAGDRELPPTTGSAKRSGYPSLSSSPAPTLAAGRRMAPIRVRLLGGMSLFLGEEEVPLLDWWAKAKKLFAYLVIHRGRPVSRDILLEEFWPDGDQQRAIHSLQTTLSFLRRSLRSLPDGATVADRLIVARDGNYLFDSEGSCESDLQRFDDHFQEAARLKASDRMEEAAAHWTEADRLYVGDLLPEFPYEDWCAPPRERVRAHYLELLLNLGTYHRQGQRPREALRMAERMFAFDGCDERAHRMAMRCHVQMGRPVDALRQFERCCQVLERELRVQPSKATRDLHDLIRQRMGAAATPGAHARADSLATGTS